MPRKDNDVLSINKIVGNHIRNLRISQGLSRSDVCNALGVSQQQLHKYEIGTNVISVGRLNCIAEILNISLSEFFADLSVSSKVRVDKSNLSNSRLFLKIFRKLHKLDNALVIMGINEVLRLLVDAYKKTDSK